MNDEQQGIKSGIALDIDDTLSDTFPHYVSEVNKRWPNPEGLSVEQVVEKYRIMPNVPYWQTDEVQKWLLAQAVSNEEQEVIPVVQGAVDAVKKINEDIPVRLYITSRPSVVHEGTQRWLDKNGFPRAELITRAGEYDKMNGNEWKANVFQKRYPEIGFIVDDNPAIVQALPKDYKGTVILFGHHPLKDEISSTSLTIKQCHTWEDVVKKTTSKM